MSLPLNEFTPMFQRIREKNSYCNSYKDQDHEHGLNDGPRDYMILRPIPQKVYVFRFLYA